MYGKQSLWIIQHSYSIFPLSLQQADSELQQELNLGIDFLPQTRTRAMIYNMI